MPDVTDSVVPQTERLPSPPDLIAPEDFASVASTHEVFREQHLDSDVDALTKAFPDHVGPTELFGDLHRQNPKAALQLATAANRFPKAGEEFAGFRLVRELGRGAFSRVFLAEQADLEGRQVVLKVTLDARTEVRALARLLHTNIVPVYSVHRSGLFQAVCMPFCGSMTLADALRRFRGETLPDSGRGLITLLHSTAASTLTPADPSAVPDPAVPAPPSSSVVLDLLGGLSYVDAILWLAARLADGLAHAHERGVLHRDLKPANVLFTDDGQPMLLDFNLSADTRFDGLAEAARLGGTLPYMAPEHLESFGGQKRVVDARSDVYALGVILYELLTGRPPFRIFGRANPESLKRMVAERQTVPGLAERNPAVTPAVESIVRTCLDPDPARRYPTARALQDDLERQLNHQPLRYAPDRNPRERLRKWARRHPRLSSAVTLGSVAAALLVGTVAAAVYQRERRLGLEARENRSAFLDDARRFQISLTRISHEDDRQRTLEAVAKGRRALGRYPAPDDPNWTTARSVRFLADGDRDDVREEIAVALLMLAHATAKGGDEAAATEALRLNEQAVNCFPKNAVPAAVWEQRAELLRSLGRDDEARGLNAAVDTKAPTSARELYLAGWNHIRHGRSADALPLLQDATRKDPAAMWAWFLLGRCHDELGQDADAAACYGTCLALTPDSHEAWHNRGLAHLRRRDFRNARADFDRAIELHSDEPAAYFHRGLAREGLDDQVGAEADYTRAIGLGAEFTRIYFRRAIVRAKLGNKDGAAADRKEGLSREPVEESCWTARGYARLGDDPKGALADFDMALKKNPLYRPALMNKAGVLADGLNRPADAVAVLDGVVKLYPTFIQARAGRAVYLARCGRRAEAHRDAEEALRQSDDPAVRYQVAGVYALTSKTHPDDRREAFRLLAGALQKEYGFEFLDIDPELDPVRTLPEFKELVAAAKALRSK